jgi:hypothetical protein
MLENDGNGNFTQITTGTIPNCGSYNKEPSWTDFDQDGDIDAFFAVNNYFSGNNKFFSNDGNNNFWLFIDLVGTQSNTNGIDALISVTSTINGQEVTQTKRCSDRNSMTTHFGMVDDAIIEEIVVEWPSGNVTILESVLVNQVLTIQEEFVFPVPQNLEVEHTYAFPENYYDLSWEAPEPCSATLTGYNIYTNDELYLTVGSDTLNIMLINVPGNANAEILFYITASYIDPEGESEPSNSVLCGIASKAQNNLINSFKLYNYPNPFNPETTITFFTNESAENTEISIFNVKGEKIRILVNEVLPTGNHSVIWNGRDDNNQAVSSGIYFYKMKTGEYISTNKMILMK